MNNISFQGRTDLIFNKSIYDKIVTRQTTGAVSNLNVAAGDISRLHKTRFIALNPNDMDKTGVMLFNEKGGVFFRNAQNKLAEIEDCIETLKTKAKNKLTAWIIGGYRGANTERSVGALAEILCDRPDIDTSILAGQKCVTPNLTLHQLSNKLEINIDMLPKKQNEIEQALYDYYDIVELNNIHIN